MTIVRTAIVISVRDLQRPTDYDQQTDKNLVTIQVLEVTVTSLWGLFWQLLWQK